MICAPVRRGALPPCPARSLSRSPRTCCPRSRPRRRVALVSANTPTASLLKYRNVFRAIVTPLMCVFASSVPVGPNDHPVRGSRSRLRCRRGSRIRGCRTRYPRSARSRSAWAWPEVRRRLLRPCPTLHRRYLCGGIAHRIHAGEAKPANSDVGRLHQQQLPQPAQLRARRPSSVTLAGDPFGAIPSNTRWSRWSGGSSERTSIVLPFKRGLNMMYTVAEPRVLSAASSASRNEIPSRPGFASAQRSKTCCR